MVNVTYYVDSAKAHVLRLRGKSISREETEKFILALENDSYFSNVLSPLSNLVGKGERFINMDLNVVPEKVIEDYGRALEGEGEGAGANSEDVSQGSEPEKPASKNPEAVPSEAEKNP